MAIYKHAMTKEGAITCLTRHQVEQAGGKRPKHIHKVFLDAYKEMDENSIKDLYKETFGMELEIIKQRK